MAEKERGEEKPRPKETARTPADARRAAGINRWLDVVAERIDLALRRLME